jgi:hypothetical protein
MKFVFHDGGRAAAGFKGGTNDCLCRSISIIAGLPYHEVYDALTALGAKERHSVELLKALPLSRCTRIRRT